MTKIGIRAYPDSVVEKLKRFEIDYFEATVRGRYAKDEKTVVPETNIDTYSSIKDKIKGIHGSILREGVNFMNKARNKKLNSNAIENAISAADNLNVEYIVFHPGYIEKGRQGENCNLENLYQFMRNYDDPRILLEIVPVFAYKERFVFPLHSVDDYKILRDRTRKNIMLDIGHAMITARAMKYDPVDYIGKLIEELDIGVMHIADNDDSGDGYNDSHLHIGKGNVPIEQILRQFKDKIKFATLEVNGINDEDIKLVTSWLQKS